MCHGHCCSVGRPTRDSTLLSFPPPPQDYYQSLLDKRLLSDIEKRNKSSNGHDDADDDSESGGEPKAKKRKAAKRIGSFREKSDREYFADVENGGASAHHDDEVKFVDSLERDSINTTSVVSVSMQNMVMQLRKCCNHPYLLEYPLTPGVSGWVGRVTGSKSVTWCVRARKIISNRRLIPLTPPPRATFVSMKSSSSAAASCSCWTSCCPRSASRATRCSSFRK